MDLDALLAGLDENQQRAVTTPGQPLCILAGAGSGKTRVLTRRIAHRCHNGEVDPRRVLALTFTRKAAGELSARLRSFGLRDLPLAGTFHATAYAQLRDRWAGADQRPPTLLDRKGRLLARILGGSRRLSPGELASEIEWAKGRLVVPAQYAVEAARAKRVTPVPHERMAELYRRYEEEKQTRRLVDFDDLLARCAGAVEADPAFAAAQRWRFRHLFVDEYQDVNPLQERLLRTWLGDRTDLCVVGDPNQAIYRWNGADPSYLIDFSRHHPGAEIIDLLDNYRSTPEILAVSASVLVGGRSRARPMRANVSRGPIPTVVGFDTDVGEARGIARRLRDEHGPRVPWSAQAVLVRTNAQTALIESALRKVRIPYRVRGGLALLDEPDVKDLLGGLGRSTEPFLTTLADLRTALGPSSGPDRADAGTGARPTVDDPDLIESLVSPDSDEARRRAALDTLLRLGEEFLVLDRHAPASAFPGWLRAAVRSEEPDRGGDAVTLASFHAAKGLEWAVVHLAGLEDGFCPINHAQETSARAEERRLVYVAITRAERALHITWARSRVFGAREMKRSPSPYLQDVLVSIGALHDADAAAPAPAARLAETRSVLAEVAAAETPLAPREGWAEPDGDQRLLDDLRRWRADVARVARVSPSVVLEDRTLAAVAACRPTDRAQLGRVPGLGPIRTERYGSTLLALVAGHPSCDTGQG